VCGVRPAPLAAVARGAGPAPPAVAHMGQGQLPWRRRTGRACSRSSIVERAGAVACSDQAPPTAALGPDPSPVRARLWAFSFFVFLID
jgi:hypothetical protein